MNFTSTFYYYIGRLAIAIKSERLFMWAFGKLVDMDRRDHPETIVRTIFNL